MGVHECIHDVCIVRSYVFIHVCMRLYEFMPILRCVFKTVYCMCFRDMQIDFFKCICLCLHCFWINICNQFELYSYLGIV